MMLKGLQAASSQAKAIAGAPARLNSVVSRRRHAAFKSGRQAVRISATAEPSDESSAAAPRASRAPKREVTVDLAQVKPGDEFEGVVTAIEGYGAFVNFGAEKDGLVHISQLSNKFVKSIGETVSVNDAVKVRVLSVDAAAGKIALTMKTESSAGADDAAGNEDFDYEDDEEEDGDVMPEDGHEFVYADSVADFQFPFQMEEEDAELTVNVVNEFEDAEMEFESVLDIDVPLNELVTGKVTRVEDYGAFIKFPFGTREYTAFLERDEAKIPAAALSAEELADYVEEGDMVSEYIDTEFDDMRTYYKVGDDVSAFILEYGDKGINLTQYTDVEVEADGFELEEDEDEQDDEPLSMMGSTSVDVLALDPEDLLNDEDSAAEVASEEAAASDAVSEFRVYGRGPLRGALFSKGDMTLPSVNFPDRPSDKLDAFAINSLQVTDRDFDGDEIYLEDLWQESIPVPKDALKRLGLKMVYDDKGEATVVEREGEVAEEDPVLALYGDHNARVAAFVNDLLDEDEEDEAELPALAMRRPIVLSVSVENIPAAVVKKLRDKTGAGMMDCKKALGACEGDSDKAVEWLRQKGLSGADKKAGRVAAEGAISTYIHPGSRLGCLLEVNCETDFVAASDKFQSLVGELGMIIAASPEVTVVTVDEVSPEVLAKEREVEMGKEDIKSKPEAVRAKIVDGRIEKMKNTMALVNQNSLRDPNKTVAEIVKETIAAIGENIQIRRFVKYNLGEGLEKRSNDFAAEVAQQTQAKAAAPKKEEPKKEEPKKEEAKAAINVPASLVKELRDKTGAGMMDCKKALGENNGDIETSIEWLRKKGLSGADKKAGRLAAEGVIASYIHPGSRLGVLLEVNCETDFVAASDPFNNLVNGLAMQIAASPQVQYVSAEDIPAEVFEREKQIEMGREDLQSKPDAIRAKIAEGRVQKLAQEMALLPQPYLMDNSKTVEQAVKEAIAAIGEKISIRRFVKFQLGEGIEKKVMDLAADVAAMTKA